MKIIITEEQYRMLNEGYEKIPRINSLCQQSKKRKVENSPFCRLQNLRSRIKNEYLVSRLDEAIEILDAFFIRKNNGSFPSLITKALEDESRSIYFLNSVAEFIQDPEFNNDQTKRKLVKVRKSNDLPVDYDSLLTQVRHKEHQKFERDLEGTEFKKHTTSLSLDYKCGEKQDASTFLGLLKQVTDKVITKSGLLFQMKGCIGRSMYNGNGFVKSDVKSITDLYHEGKLIFPKDSIFEAKKMDPLIDSYLSEFFAIFKNKSAIEVKPQYIELYREVINNIFDWIQVKGVDYLNKVRDNMAAVIFQGNIVVPIEYVELYWSNRGQRGCDEPRLSIRFRIHPQYNTITGYKYTKGNKELEKVEMKVERQDTEKIICQ
jgi:hypothetical protein